LKNISNDYNLKLQEQFRLKKVVFECKNSQRLTALVFYKFWLKLKINMEFW